MNLDNKKENKFSWKSDLLLLVAIILIGAGGYEVFAYLVNSQAEKPSSTSTADLLRPENDLLAPDFQVEDIFDNQITLSEFKGKKPVLVIFWATWCTYCAQELPDLKTFYREQKDKVEIIVITSGESKEIVRDYIKEKNVNFPMFLDKNRAVWNTYAIRGTPTHVLVGKNGNVITAWPGLADIGTLEMMLTMFP